MARGRKRRSFPNFRFVCNSAYSISSRVPRKAWMDQRSTTQACSQAFARKTVKAARETGFSRILVCDRGTFG